LAPAHVLRLRPHWVWVSAWGCLQMRCVARWSTVWVHEAIESWSGCVVSARNGGVGKRTRRKCRIERIRPGRSTHLLLALVAVDELERIHQLHVRAAAHKSLEAACGCDVQPPHRIVKVDGAAVLCAQQRAAVTHLARRPRACECELKLPVSPPLTLPCRRFWWWDRRVGSPQRTSASGRRRSQRGRGWRPQLA
jgi:hypothetical protein